MNAKYFTPRHAITAPVVAALLVLSASCVDDFGYNKNEGKQIAFSITAYDSWYNGMSVDESAPTSRCTSVQPLTGGDTKLYLHTVVGENTTEEAGGAGSRLATRGTPLKGIEAFKKEYDKFSLSGICYLGKYEGNETDWTPNYAYNLNYSTSTGNAVEGGKPLQWPREGKVRFFAFAPTETDFNGKNTDGVLALSGADEKGSPTLTYTVPTDVEKQIDLMTTYADASGLTSSSPEVELKFRHALTAVQIKCDESMRSSEITEVSISGVYGTGEHTIGSDAWETIGDHNATYTIKKTITLNPKPGDEGGDGIHVSNGTQIIGKEGDNLTFLLVPQTLPEGAQLTIKFKDKTAGTEHTLTGALAGETWDSGKIVTYTVSPSSVHIRAAVEFAKKSIGSKDKAAGDTIPYSGVWYDAPLKAKGYLTIGDTEKEFAIPADKITVEYSFFHEDSNNWDEWAKSPEIDNKEEIEDINALIRIPAQSHYADIQKGDGHSFKTGTSGSKESPTSLILNGESANCYLVDRAGYYSLPLVYGNLNGKPVPAGNKNGLNYYPKHDNLQMGSADISGVHDAVLVWQDAPDLIDTQSVKVNENKNKLEFHIRELTLAQGNAVVAVRNASHDILWSWHIWVTPYKDDFYNNLYNTVTDPGEKYKKEYNFAQYNLGWCDRHEGDKARKFKLRAIVNMSGYGDVEGTAVNGSEVKTTVELGEFTQMEFKGSKAGDNTYYQWGRKDPMLGGIYNDNTPTFKYYKKGVNSKEDAVEFTMENKQVFNQYINPEENCNYSFRKNPGDMIDLSDEASRGVTIGYTIKHPYMFITNSSCTDTQSSDGEEFNDNDKNDTAHKYNDGVKFSYRNHWHIPFFNESGGRNTIPYLNQKEVAQENHIMFNAWNVDATEIGQIVNSTTEFNNKKEEIIRKNSVEVKKSVYDPCPPGFKMPPANAFRGIPNDLYGCYKGTVSFDGSKREWTITGNSKTIKFPATGVRNYALRSSEWSTVVINEKYNGAYNGTSGSFDNRELYKTSLPAFKDLTFVSSATIVDATSSNSAFQVLLFWIDGRKTTAPDYLKSFVRSSNSYGLAVRPIKD